MSVCRVECAVELRRFSHIAACDPVGELLSTTTSLLSVHFTHLSSTVDHELCFVSCCQHREDDE